MSKPCIEICGTLDYAPQVGCAAFIRDDSGCRRTSAVLRFYVAPSGAIHIETKNTNYIVRPKQTERKGGCIHG